MDVLDAPISHSRIRYPSSSDFSPMMRPAPAYLEQARWGDGFACPHCGTAGEPFHFENRPGVLRCRKCRQNTGLTVGTVMERSHTPLNVWFWAAYLVASQTPGMSAVQFQRQLGLSRYETAFQILHKLRSGMVRPNQDRIGGQPKNHVEVDENLGWRANAAEQYLPIIHLVFANLKTWLICIHHGVSHQHLQAYLNEFTFRFNRRFYPFNAFRSLLGIAGDTSAPTYAELYSGEWRHPTCSGSWALTG